MVKMLKICRCCGKTEKGIAPRYTVEWGEAKVLDPFVFRKRVCSTCRNMARESVTVTCLNCDSLTMLNTDFVIEKTGLKWKMTPEELNGEVMDLEFCPNCKMSDNPSRRYKFKVA